MSNSLPQPLIDAAARVLEANRVAGKRVSVAESCTGGLVSAALTSLAGSSDVFEVGFITYSNNAKMSILNVDEIILDTFGAVSSATAWAMAQGALEKSGADVAVAITGIAGPGGGSTQKPVGTVVFARARKGDTADDILADTQYFEDTGRNDIQMQAALVALDLLMPVGQPAP